MRKELLSSAVNYRWSWLHIWSIARTSGSRGTQLTYARAGDPERVDKKTPRARACSPMGCPGAARLIPTAPRSDDAVTLHRGACEKRLRDGTLATSSACYIITTGPASKIPDKRHSVKGESPGLKHLRGHDAREGSRCLHMVIPAVVKPVNGSRRVRLRARRPHTVVFSLVSLYHRGAEALS
jgi:hypothetical protein